MCEHWSHVKHRSQPKFELQIFSSLDPISFTVPCPQVRYTNLQRMETSREEVEFKTLDGLTLRGVLFPAGKHSPAIILAPGVGYSDFIFHSIAAPQVCGLEACFDTMLLH